VLTNRTTVTIKWTNKDDDIVHAGSVSRPEKTQIWLRCCPSYRATRVATAENKAYTTP
jgi:hypothetical protein